MKPVIRTDQAARYRSCDPILSLREETYPPVSSQHRTADVRGGDGEVTEGAERAEGALDE